MDVEIAEKSNISWLQMLDRKANGATTIWLPSGHPYGVAGTSSAIVMQQVPMLDWAVDLFDDVKSYH